MTETLKKVAGNMKKTVGACNAEQGGHFRRLL